MRKLLSSKRIITASLCAVMVLTSIAGGKTLTGNLGITPTNVVEASKVKQTVSKEIKTPKYIFMFIGDGMAAVQVNSAQIYKGNNQHNNMALREVNFQQFDAVGYQTTHDATSFAPDSASTATALSSGFKTWSGTLGLKPVGNVSGNTSENVNEKKVPKTIAERLKEEKGMKIGIVSTVTINQPTGKNKDQKDAYEVMKEKGYTIANTKKDILALNSKSGKAYAVTPVTQDGGAMPYAIDNKKGDLTLADYVKKGIDVLDNKNGFFMMTESGKIDWAGHANDAKANIGDVLAFTDAIQVAIDFAKKHPTETLIIVTGDHETGGMTIGQATTGYDTAFDILDSQKMSYVAFDALIDDMKKANPNLTFAEVLPVITKNFGLVNKRVIIHYQ